MQKYYTRACNFYYGKISRNLIKKKLAFPLCGNNQIAFDKIEIFIRNKKKITSKIISIKNISKQRKNIRKKIILDVKKIISKRKNFYNPGIMGVLNMTPDSFSDGGKFNSNIKSFKKISLMIKAGANIIDVGGESTRPGSLIISPKKEWSRVQKVIKKFKKKYPKILLSIDTRKSQVMVNSMKYKTDIINDVSSFNYDVNSIKVLEGKNVWKIIHHMQGTPQTMQINPKYKNVLLDIYDFFEKKIKFFGKKKKYSSKIILDPGIGFGKKLKT